jgi:hypothetical protein
MGSLSLVGRLRAAALFSAIRAVLLGHLMAVVRIEEVVSQGRREKEMFVSSSNKPTRKSSEPSVDNS